MKVHRVRNIIRHFCRIVTVLSLSLLTLAPGAFGQGRAEDIFQQALRMERVSGDLEEAIRLYQQVVETGDRPFGARALVRIAESYEKLGQQGAQDAYNRILQDFGDQSEQVALARERLAALERPQAETGAKTITTRRIWSGLDADIQDPTPDGKYFVHADGTGNLVLREVSTGETRSLTHDATEGVFHGRVSPDGKWVAHELHMHGQWGSLRVVGTDGDNLRVLSREPGCWIQPYDWTSDGRQIVARRDCADTHEIVLVSLSDGTTRVVHELPGYTECFLSPDNRYFVCGSPVEEDNGNADIWLLSFDGGDPTPLIQHPADDRILGWVPGTDFVVFLSNRDGLWDLWAAAVHDGTMEDKPRKIWRAMGEVASAGFSEDGSFFYGMGTRWFNTSIAPFDLATGRVDLDAATPLLGSNRNPQWSPDGQRLAFVRESELTEGKYGRINIRNLATGEQQEVATHLRARILGDWSPDGRSLLVPGDDGTDAPHFWEVDVATGEGTPLVPIPDANEWWGGWTWADWSPDGDTILYSVMNDGTGRGRLVRRDLRSGEEEELYRDSVLVRRPFELSPDGRQVAFVFMDSLNADWPGGIALLDLDSGATRRLVTFGDSLGEWEVSLQWTPDGEDILYSEIIAGEALHTNVSRVRATGGDPEYLWTFGEGKFAGYFDLSPDGSQIALTTYTQEAEIWVMENLVAVLKEAGVGR
jgi:Tol biopolymer transport system component